MKVLHTIPAFGLMSGGTTSATYDLLLALHEHGCNADLMTSANVCEGDRIAGNGEEWIKVVEDDTCFHPYCYSKNFKRALLDSDYDIYQCNGLWMYADHITAKTARQKGKKFVLTPHGMLYPDSRRWKNITKIPFRKFIFDKDIMKADCVHVTCMQELEVVRNYGYRGPIAVIPNLVHIAEDAHLSSLEDKCTFSVGFLGRLHPRKHIENVLYGVAGTPQKEKIHIVVMGKGDDRYESFLKSEAERLNLDVDFKGFVKGKEKFDVLRSLSLLMVPSDFENFGMIVAEALICGTPVMSSLRTPWEQLNSHRCGWWVDRSPESLSKVIDEAYNLPKEEILAMGTRGRKLIEENFTPEIVAKKMIDLYHWLMGEIEKPDFVYER